MRSESRRGRGKKVCAEPRRLAGEGVRERSEPTGEEGERGRRRERETTKSQGKVAVMSLCATETHISFVSSRSLSVLDADALESKERRGRFVGDRSRSRCSGRVF